MRNKEHFWRSLLGLTVFFIVYATLIPFHFRIETRGLWPQLIDGLHYTFRTPNGGASTFDFVQNVIFFLPFGYFASRVTSTLIASRLLTALLVICSGATLSFSVECLQLFTTDRWSSYFDVISNSLGTACGFVLGLGAFSFSDWIVENKYVQAWTSTRLGFTLFGLFAMLCGQAWQPFNFSLDFGLFKEKIKFVLYEFHHGFQGSWSEKINDWFFYGLFFIVLQAFLQQKKFVWPRLTATLLIAALAFGLECTQLIIQSRGFSLQDICVAISGITAALLLSYIPLNKNRIALLLFLATYFVAAILALYPFHFGLAYQSINWLPFFAYYENTDFNSLSHFFDILFLYMPLGFLLNYSQTTNQKNSDLRIALLAISIALPLELAQGFIDGRFPDITEVIVALLGAWIGNWIWHFGWSAFKEV